MRRDSFKNVRFGSGPGSKNASKSPSPKTLVNLSPPSNPYKDIQSSFPTELSYFSHDTILLWIALLSVYHLFCQMYLLYGEKLRNWDWTVVVTALCCILDKMYSVQYKDHSPAPSLAKSSWRDRVSQSKLVIFFNFILLATLFRTYQTVHTFDEKTLTKDAILIVLFNSRFVLQYFVLYSTAKNTPKNTQIVTQKKANGNINSFHVEEQTSSFLNLILKGITEILWNCINITIYTTCLPFIPLYFASHSYLFMWYDVIINTMLVIFLIFPLFSLFYYESTRFSLILRSKNLKLSGNSSNENQSFLSRLILFVTENDLKGLPSYQGRHSFISSLCFTCLWLILCMEMTILFWTRMIRLQTTLYGGLLVLSFTICVGISTFNNSPHFVPVNYHFARSDESVPANGEHQPPQQQQQQQQQSTTSQHPMISEFDRNMKIIFSNIPSVTELQEKYQDYTQRIEELQHSKNVQFMMNKQHQHQEQLKRQESRQPAPPAAPLAPAEQSPKNSEISQAPQRPLPMKGGSANNANGITVHQPISQKPPAISSSHPNKNRTNPNNNPASASNNPPNNNSNSTHPNNNANNNRSGPRPGNRFNQNSAINSITSRNTHVNSQSIHHSPHSPNSPHSPANSQPQAPNLFPPPIPNAPALTTPSSVTNSPAAHTTPPQKGLTRSPNQPAGSHHNSPATSTTSPGHHPSPQQQSSSHLSSSRSGKKTTPDKH